MTRHLDDYLTLPLLSWAAVVAAIALVCWVASIKNGPRP